MDLRVTRSAGASDCPDAAALRASVARVVERDVPGSGPDGAADLSLDVSFSRQGARYVATVTDTDPGSGGERTMAHESATCAALAEAVVATIALRVDDRADASEDSAASEAPAPPPSPPPSPAPPRPPVPRRAAPDPDDLPPSEPVAAPSDPGSRPSWYGWQILAADATAVTVLFAATRTTGTFSSVAGGSSILGFALDGLVIHAIHGRADAAAGSLALRFGGIFLGGLIGNALTTCPTGGTGLGDAIGCWFDHVGGTAVGAGIGLLAGEAIDVAVLSWEKARPPRSDAGAARAPRIAPVATVLRQPGGPAGLMVGVVGAL
jgi:hypothetical protein